MKKYLVTVTSVLLIGCIKLALQKIFLYESPFFLFFAAVGVSAWFGGSRQGILAYVLSLLFMGGFFLPPFPTMKLMEGQWIYRFILYGVDCFIIILVCSKLRGSRNVLKQALNDLTAVEKILGENESSAEKLKQSQSFLDSVIENIPNMIFVKEAKDLKFVRFNKAGENLLGESRDNLMGKSDYDFFSKSEADYFTGKDREVIQGKKVVDIPEEPIATKFGTRYLHTKKIPIFDKDGKPQYLLGISEDITEKKEAEKQKLALLEEIAARSEAERTAARFHFLSRATAALNESLDIDSMLNSFANVAVQNLADCCLIDFVNEDTGEPERVVAASGEGLVATKSPKELKELKKKLNLLLAPEIQKTLKNPWGRVFTPPAEAESCVKSGMIVALTSYGKIFGTLILLSSRSSPTPRIFTDSDLSMAEDLGRRASLAIENAKLYNKANEASRAKSAFLANMSHEIRTPLGAILGYAELTLEGEMKEEQRQHLQTIIRNGRQLLHIVDEILDLSKVESERIRIEKLAFSLPKLLEEIISLLKLKAQEKGVALTMTLPEGLPDQVITDPTRLRQILINMIGNAIKFTEKGEVAVNVTFKPIRTGSKRYNIFIDIKDSGIGITDEQMGILFKPFVQADGSMTRKFGGTGLGLHLSRKLARLLDGDVILKSSEYGKGSHFVVSVEVELSAADKKTAVEPQLELGASPQVLKASKVLVVDDSVDNRLLVTRYLAKMGVAFDVAENGREGVEKAMKSPYDMVFMDLQMPEMDGFQAMQLLRNKSYNRPIVALTAHAMKGDRERCIEAGFDDYLCKPLTKDSLKKSLEHNIHG